MPFVSVLHTSSNRLLLSNQDKGCTPSVAHSLPLPLGPALLNLWTNVSAQGGGEELYPVKLVIVPAIHRVREFTEDESEGYQKSGIAFKTTTGSKYDNVEWQSTS